MSESNSSSTASRFPDLYAQLGLQPLETDQQLIQSALERLATRVQSMELSGTDQADVLRRTKLLQLGRQHLLSPKHKARYDQLWRQHYQQRLVGDESHTASAAPRLARLLPSGDPTAPFRLSDYLEYAASSPPRSSFADWEQLLKWLQSDVEEPSGNDQTKGPANHVEIPVADAAAPALRSGWETTEQSPAGATVLRGPLPRRSRRQRERIVLWSVFAGLSLIGAFLGFRFWSLRSAATGHQQSHATNSAMGTAADLSDARQSALPVPDSPRRSGLPSVRGIAPGQDLTRHLDHLPPVAAAAGTSEGEAEPKAQDESPDLTAVEPLSTAVDSMPMTSPITALTAADGPAAQTTVSTAREIQLDAAARAEWAAAMSEAKRLVGQQLYAQAAEQLTKCGALAKSGQQKSQLERLSELARLAKELHQALQEALAGLSAGEVITVGSSTPVAVVEAAEDQLTVRLRGENRSFRLTELPVGLVFALSDLSLAPDAPGTLARKAAFAWVHPPAIGSDMALQRAKEMMSTAAAEGSVDRDLLQVFTDDYQLPDSAN